MRTDRIVRRLERLEQNARVRYDLAAETAEYGDRLWGDGRQRCYARDDDGSLQLTIVTGHQDMLRYTVAGISSADLI
jgi:hypothetical protein